VLDFIETLPQDGYQIQELTAQKAALSTDIAEMQETVAALAKKGARIKIDNYGGRLCVAVNTDQGQSMWIGVARGCRWRFRKGIRAEKTRHEI
jgi:hypothetical protein